VNINWNKLQVVSQNAVTTLANATTQIPGFSSSANHTAAAATTQIPGFSSSVRYTDIGIPLTVGASVGFTIGFLKG
jgi:hypothetical protein